MKKESVKEKIVKRETKGIKEDKSKEELDRLKKVLKESREQCKKMERLLNSKS